MKKLLDLLNFESHLRCLDKARPNDFVGLIQSVGRTFPTPALDRVN